MSKSLTTNPVLTLQSSSFVLCENIVRSYSISAEPVVTQKLIDVVKQAAFNPFVVSLGNGASHVNHQHNNDDECSNNDVHALIGGLGGIEGLGGVGSHGKCRCRSSGVLRRLCMSDRGVKSRFKSNAYTSTTTNTISVNDDMTTTDNDGSTTSHVQRPWPWAPPFGLRSCRRAIRGRHHPKQ